MKPGLWRRSVPRGPVLVLPVMAFPVLAFPVLVRRALIGLALVGLVACRGSEPGTSAGPEQAVADADPILRVVSRRHTEITRDGEGQLWQTFFPSDGIGLCYHVDPRVDTSRWRARLLLDGQPASEEPMGPAARSGGVICFESETLPPTSAARVEELPPEGGTVELCGELIDDFDGQSRTGDCLSLRLLASDAERLPLRKRRRELMRTGWNMPVARVMEEFDALVRDADEAGFLAFAASARLVALHFLAREGSAEVREEIRQRLDAMPDWADGMGASLVGASLAYQRSIVANQEGRRSDAWRHLAIAEERYRANGRSALAAVLGMSEILSKSGALREARSRLASSLAECADQAELAGRRTCSEAMIQSGRTNQIWWTLLDEAADRDSLEQARALLRAALESDPKGDPLEIPNHLLNLAYLRLRLAEDPSEPLRRARSELEKSDAGGERRRDLLAWGRLMEARSQLDRGEAEAALRNCESPSTDLEPRLAAMAASCAGRAHRALGNLEAAADAFEKAMLRHEAAFDWQQGRGLPLGPGQRAEDFARAARVEVERQRPMEAWTLLRRLDRLSLAEAARRRCREQAESQEDRQQWADLEAESAAILETLRELDGPASAARRRELDRSTAELKTRLRNLWRDWPGCEAPREVDDAGVDYRAVALDDQVLLLHRRGAEVEARQTAIDRREIRQSLVELDRLAPLSEDVDAWRRRAAPLAEALAPREPLPERAVYALHGLLQETPLVALPIGDDAWLGQRTLVSVRPAGSQAAPPSPASAAASLPVFVIDPSNNLTAASGMVETYRSLFPGARFLQGREALHDTVLGAVSDADWLHVDAHGIYDGVAPELSALRMADRPLHWLELADTSPRSSFANLSGCQTGRWPISADSGTYGLAGLLTRLGVPWAVGSRTNLPDDTAADFNTAFYEAIAEGSDPATAYAAGIRSIADTYPPAAWSGLVLLEASGARFGPKIAFFTVPGGQP